MILISFLLPLLLIFTQSPLFSFVLAVGVVDAAVMGGTANYEEAFCNPLFLQTHPGKAKLVDKLQVVSTTETIGT